MVKMVRQFALFGQMLGWNRGSTIFDIAFPGATSIIAASSRVPHELAREWRGARAGHIELTPVGAPESAGVECEFAGSGREHERAKAYGRFGEKHLFRVRTRCPSVHTRLPSTVMTAARLPRERANHSIIHAS